MKKKLFAFLVIALAIGGLQAQDLQIHKTDGTIINVPLNAIDSITFTESGNNAPLADFTANPTSGTTPLTVNFTDQSTNNPTNWLWDFGDGNSSTQQNPEHIYQVAGSYTLQLNVSNIYGADAITKNQYINVTSGGSGSGTQNDPYTVAFAIENQNTNPYTVGWVKGYIIGAVKAGTTIVTSSDDIDFSPPFSSATNVLIADNPDATNYMNCVAVNLPAGTPLRSEVNLMDNPENLGKWLKVNGTLRTYFGIAGLRDSSGSTNDFEIENGGSGGTLIFLETFASDLGSFTTYSVVGAQTWGWAQFDEGCAVMTGHVSGTNYTNEDWLISPAISLAGESEVVLNIREAINYITSYDDLQVLISNDYDGSSDPSTNGTWTSLSGFNRPPGNNWTFVNSGDISLAAFEGQTIYVAFKYLSTTVASSTWEISKVEVSTKSTGGQGQPCPGTPTVTDIDGNVYNTVLIGDQCWMKENLKTTQYRNGTPIENPTNNSDWQNNTIGAYAWYENDISWKDSYGALYNWHAVKNTNGLCPTGWHVPSDAEWSQLVDYVVAQGFPNQYDNPNGAGNALKSCRQINSPLGGNCNTSEHPCWSEVWPGNNNHGFDEYGFSALPGGYRFYDGNFTSIGSYGFWWSSTEYDTNNAWHRYLNYGSGSVYRDYNYKTDGFSVRCLRD